MDEREKSALIATAHALADAAREVTLRYFRAPGLVAETKESHRFDPVTAADRAAEARIREMLAESRPDDAVLGEEFGNRPGSSGLTWVIDPIDGTRAFMSGAPTWGVLIAVQDASGPVYGVIDQPYIGERFSGGFGEAWVEGPRGRQAMRVRRTDRLDEATIFTTFPEVGTEAEGRAFHALARRTRLTRYGMDCYAYALLALGQVDLVVEAGLQPYDVQAPIAVIEAAGGRTSDWRGRPAHMGGRILAAGSAALHEAALEILSQAGD